VAVEFAEVVAGGEQFPLAAGVIYFDLKKSKQLPL